MDTVSRTKPARRDRHPGRGIGIWSLINSGMLDVPADPWDRGCSLGLIWLLPERHAAAWPARPAAARVAHVTSVHRQRRSADRSEGMRHAGQAGYDVTLIARGPPPPSAVGGEFVSLGEARGRLTRMLVMPDPRPARRSPRPCRTVSPARPRAAAGRIVLKLGGAASRLRRARGLPRQIAYKPYIPGWAQRPLASPRRALEQASRCRVLDGVVAATPRIAARFPAGKTIARPELPAARASSRRADAAIPGAPGARRLHRSPHAARSVRDGDGGRRQDRAPRGAMSGSRSPDRSNPRLAETITRRTSAVTRGAARPAGSHRGRGPPPRCARAAWCCSSR